MGFINPAVHVKTKGADGGQAKEKKDQEAFSLFTGLGANDLLYRAPERTKTAKKKVEKEEVHFDRRQQRW